MSRDSHASDPIRSADHIEDPDQPAVINGEDRAAGSHAVDHAHAPQQTAATAATTGGHDAQDVSGQDAHRIAEEGGKPPKVVSETGFPKVDKDVMEAQAAREVDTTALADQRKFQPPAERDEFNASAHKPLIIDQGQHDAEGKSTGHEIPLSEPVEHSQIVEERVQSQESTYDLEETEEGERYLTPRDAEGGAGTARN